MAAELEKPTPATEPDAGKAEEQLPLPGPPGEAATAAVEAETPAQPEAPA
jgi:hypothetical protein